MKSASRPTPAAWLLGLGLGALAGLIGQSLLQPQALAEMVTTSPDATMLTISTVTGADALVMLDQRAEEILVYEQRLGNTAASANRLILRGRYSLPTLFAEGRVSTGLAPLDAQSPAGPAQAAPPGGTNPVR